MNPKGALDGIIVIDASRILAGPYCTMLLADFGAEVIKIEAPGTGDPTRQWGPPWVGEQSAYFLSANRNKKSLTLNLKSEPGREIFKKLATRADVVVENFLPGTMQRFGLDYEALASVNAGLIYCSITGYGQTGPYHDRPGYDFLIQAQGGIMSITGPADGEPCKVGVAIVDITTGLFASNAILAALHHRDKAGVGQYIDMALLDSQVAWLANVAHNHFATSESPARYGNAHPSIVPYEIFPTADGFIAIGVGSDQQFRRLCEIVGCAELGTDPAFQTNESRVRNRKRLVARLQEQTRTRSTADWLDLLVRAGLPATPINDIPTILADPQVAARDMVQEVEHPSQGSIKMLGTVAKMSKTPTQIRSAPPLLGEHTEEILARELGIDSQQIKELRREGIV